MVFVDYKQGYNIIDRERLGQILKDFGLPIKLINMIQLYNMKTSSQGEQRGIIFFYDLQRIETRGYDIASSFEYGTFCIIRKIPRTETLNLDKGNILLAYVDDIVIIGKSQEIQRTVAELIKIEKVIGFIIDSGKTKYMMVKRGKGDHNNLRVGVTLLNKYKSSNTLVLP